MVISSDEAVAKAREFANNVGWFTRMARVKEDASFIPAVWKVRLVGEYDDITIEINADSGEVSTWHSRDPSLIAYERAKPIIDNLEAQGTPVDCKQWMEILHQEQTKVLKKQKGPRSLDIDIPRFPKERSERLAKHFRSDRPNA